MGDADGTRRCHPLPGERSRQRRHRRVAAGQRTGLKHAYAASGFRSTARNRMPRLPASAVASHSAPWGSPPQRAGGGEIGISKPLELRPYISHSRKRHYWLIVWLFRLRKLRARHIPSILVLRHRRRSPHARSVPKIRYAAGKLAKRLRLLRRFAPAGLVDAGIRKDLRLDALPASQPARTARVY